MGAKERRVRDKAHLRRRILDAAREIVLKEGCDCVTMRRVAEKIEYTPTTIYLHFQDKEELIGTVCEETFQGLLRALEDVQKEHSDLLKRLRAGCRAYVDFGLQQPELYRVAFMTPMPHLVQPDPKLFREMAQKHPAGFKAYEFLRGAVDSCIKQGIFRKIDTETATQVMWASIHGIVSLLIVKPFFPWIPKDRLIDAVVDGAIRSLQK